QLPRRVLGEPRRLPDLDVECALLRERATGLGDREQLSTAEVGEEIRAAECGNRTSAVDVPAGDRAVAVGVGELVDRIDGAIGPVAFVLVRSLALVPAPVDAARAGGGE